MGVSLTGVGSWILGTGRLSKPEITLSLVLTGRKFSSNLVMPAAMLINSSWCSDNPSGFVRETGDGFLLGSV